jgi:ubiquinone/menaquinone biosynthesis C-methylase UbiE
VRAAAKAGRMNCDRLARYYEMLERMTFGRRLERRRFAFLRETVAAERALLCGDGDGRFLAELLRVNARVRVDFVDLSGGMITIAERRVRKMGESVRGRVRFFACDVMEFEPEAGGYDLIGAHFFLDCFSEAEIGAVVGRVAGWGARDARWVVSEFCEAETTVRGAWTRAVISGLYAAFQLTTGLRVTRLPNYVGALEERGFGLRKRETDLGGLLCSGIWEASVGREGFAATQVLLEGK